MVRLIASDMDGTLLDYEVFSSRSVQRLYALCAQLDCLHLALYGRTNTFLLDDLDHYVREIDKDLPRAVRVNRPPSPDVGIVKAAICYERADDIMDMVYVLERELGDVFVFMPSGKTWIDVVPRGINKATGLQVVLKRHGIDPRDVLAFGDSMDSVAVSWVSNAYGLTFGGFLLLAGRMGDLAGIKKLLVAGLAVFSASAVLWAWRSSPRALRAWGPRGPSIWRSS